MSTTGKANLIDSETEKLRRLLRAYLRSSDRSMTAVAINQIVKAYRFNWRVNIRGKSGRLFEDFTRVLGALNIDFDAFEDKITTNGREVYGWLKTGSPKTPRIWVPDAQARFVDHEVIVPFAIQRAVNEIGEQTLKTAGIYVTALYLIYLRIIAWPLRQDVEDRIFVDIADALESATTTLQAPFQGGLDLGKEMCVHLMTFFPDALMYLGCNPGDGSCRDLSADIDLVAHPINVFAANYAATRQPSTPLGGPTPRLLRTVTLNVNQVPTYERNLATLNGMVLHHERTSVVKQADPHTSTHSIDTMIRDCLKMRLRGFSEDRICEELGFANMADYSEWTKHRSIDLTPVEGPNAYEAWQQAQSFLGLHNEESAAVAGDATEDVQAQLSGAETRTAPDGPDSSDKRSLRFTTDDFTVLYGDTKFNLTDKFFRALWFIAKCHKDGNPAVRKHAVYQEAGVSSPNVSAISVRKWFKQQGGDATRIVEAGLLESDRHGNCRIPVEPALIDLGDSEPA